MKRLTRDNHHESHVLIEGSVQKPFPPESLGQIEAGHGEERGVEARQRRSGSQEREDIVSEDVKSSPLFIYQVYQVLSR